MTSLNEDTLVQQTTADYLKDHLGWDSVYAYNQETFGDGGLLGRNSDREVVLTRYLKQALQELNTGLPESSYDDAVRQVVDYSQSQSLLSSNFDKYKLFKDGVLVSFQWADGEIKKERLKVIVFDDSTGKQIKVLAKNHQYLGVNQVITALTDPQRQKGKLGVFWHTQSSGKSYSMVFFTSKAHRKIGGNYTFLICTDRDDLDTQIYKTFAGCGVADNDKNPCRPTSGKHLAKLMSHHKSHVFTTIKKFNQEVDPNEGYTTRDDIIVITDEAHRTQYGTLALNMRNALPNANFIGFTGTPLFKDDQITKQVFGDYVYTYDFQRTVEDKVTVPLYYDSRGETLGVATNDINERIMQKLEEIEQLKRQIDWMRATKTAVIVSEEQGEVDKFRKWGFDITPHRRLIKNGFELAEGTRIDVDSAFKKEEHPF